MRHSASETGGAEIVSPARKSIQPRRIFKLFGAQSLAFRASKRRVLLRIGGETDIAVDVGKLVTCLSLKRKWLRSIISLPTANGQESFSGFPHRAAQDIYEWLSAHGYNHTLAAIDSALEGISPLVLRRYLRTSRIPAIKAKAAVAFERFNKTLPATRYLPRALGKKFREIKKLAKLNEKIAESYRVHYLERMKAQYKTLFDTLEAHPLTEKQREACIIDEDNNLVLAGAGTGKTSVISGRAMFLLESGQAKANEILLLAYNNKAAKEMQERLAGREIGGVAAVTFHKLGLGIIARTKGAKPSISKLAGDDKLLAKWVEYWLEKHFADNAYCEKLLRCFEGELDNAANEFDFEKEGDYYEYIKSNEIRTLNGEEVRSIGECIIANHLYKLGVEYEYEAEYEVETRTMEFRQYCPDFYLPKYNIYIEFYGIDRKGDTAPYVNRERYHEEMKWKAALHEEHGTHLISLFHYDRMEGRLRERLEGALQKAGVTFARRSSQEMLQALKEFGEVQEFVKILSNMLRRYRNGGFDHEPEKLQAKIEQSRFPEYLADARDLLLPIVEDYNQHLRGEGEIDFDEMIGAATLCVTNGKFKPKWKYILVDEFQDIAEPQAALVQALRNAVEGCSLFCVGDDWQSIYRFAGSDIDFIVNFRAHFGATKTTSLDKTFRFNDSICDIASRFVQANPQQMRKRLATHDAASAPTVSLLRGRLPKGDAAKQIDKRLTEVLDKIQHDAVPGSTVYLLARYHFNLPAPSQLGQLHREYPNLMLGAHTIHGAKGKEADYIVVLGLVNGADGFPSRKTTHPLLDALLPAAEKFADAEERRLFYVALTRARKRVYLIADMASASGFVSELIDDKYPIERGEFEVSLVQRFFRRLYCIKCSTGSMVFRKGRDVFMGCSNYPLCRHTENICVSCGQAMEHIERFRVCIDPSCKSWVPKCEMCGADMVQRNGVSGTFWGCSNYRGNEAVSCRNTENRIVFGGV